MRNILLILTLLATLSAQAQVYERLEARATDHYDHAEWSDVISVTDRMVRIHPEDVEPYSMALVAAQFTDDITTESRYLVLSQRNGVPIENLLAAVYDRTRALHDTRIYEAILLNLKKDNQWLAKVFNHYLLDYYAFSRQFDHAIAIADELLNVTPDNVRYAKIKAESLFRRGNTDASVTLFNKILAKNPSDYDALTFLGAYYSVQAEKALNEIDSIYLKSENPIDSVFILRKQLIIDTDIQHVLSLLQQACNIRCSSYLEEQIASLESLSPRLPNHPSKRRSLLLRIKSRIEERPKE